MKNLDAAPMTTVASPSIMKILFASYKRQRPPRGQTRMGGKDAPSPSIVAPDVAHVGDSVSKEP